MLTMNLYNVTPPQQWRAGYLGPNGTQPFHFDCADCNAKEPPIAGVMSTDGTFGGIGLMGAVKTFDLRPAMFCAACFAKRKAD